MPKLKALTARGAVQWRRLKENYRKDIGTLLFHSIKSQFQGLKLTFNASKKKLSYNVPIIFLKPGATVRLTPGARPELRAKNPKKEKNLPELKSRKSQGAHQG